MNPAERIAAVFEQVAVDVASALFVFGVNVVGDVGALVVDLARAVIPGGS